MSNYIQVLKCHETLKIVFERVTSEIRCLKILKCDATFILMLVSFSLHVHFIRRLSANDPFHSQPRSICTSHCCSRYYAGKSCMCPRITVTVGTTRQLKISLKGGVVILMRVFACTWTNTHTPAIKQRRDNHLCGFSPCSSRGKICLFEGI